MVFHAKAMQRGCLFAQATVSRVSWSNPKVRSGLL